MSAWITATIPHILRDPCRARDSLSEVLGECEVSERLSCRRINIDLTLRYSLDIISNSTISSFYKFLKSLFIRRYALKVLSKAKTLDTLSTLSLENKV